MQLTETFVLEQASISVILAYIREKLKEYRLNEKDILLAELFAEEVLIRWMSSASDKDTVRVLIKRRLLSIGLSLVYKGDMIDPLAVEDLEIEDKEYLKMLSII